LRRFKAIIFALLLMCGICTIGCGGSDDPVFFNGFNRVITSLAVSPKPVTKTTGQTQQFTATATSNDGSTADVSSIVTWSSSNPAIVTVNNTGLATAVAPGVATITASGAGFNDTVNFTVTGTGTPADLIGLNAAGTGLVRFSSTNPGNPTNVNITGVTAGDVLVGIDFRPQNRFLYGLGFNSTNGTVRVYSINPDNGVANSVGTAPISFTAADGVTARPITGTGFGFDFNPAVDRIRVTTNTGQNFRLNPNNGTAIDGDTNVAGNQMDGDLNGPTTTSAGAAYTNNQPNNNNITTLYTLDGTTRSIYIQVPPNAGTQASAQAITVNGNPLNFSAVNGFDIPAGVNAAASNVAPASGSATAALTVGGVTQIYSINLLNGQATLLGFPGQNLSGLTLVPDGPPPAIALDSTGANLVRFNAATPGTTTTQAINGVGAGESLVGIDFRPATGQLYGLGVSAAGTGTVYLIDPQTGVATPPGALGAIAFVDNGGAAVLLPDPATVGYGFDFNPVVDRIRVTTNSGLNFRVNQIDGTPIDGNTGVAGTQTDGNINGSGVTGVTGAAYTNNFAGATVTTLYTLDSAGDRLLIQNPPNDGTQTTPVPLTLGGSPLDITGVNGFDILNSITTATANAPSSGTGLAVVSIAGTTRLININLTTGVTQSFGIIATGIRGFTLGRGDAFIVQ
jgi:hypothetical protein